MATKKQLQEMAIWARKPSETWARVGDGRGYDRQMAITSFRANFGSHFPDGTEWRAVKDSDEETL